MGEEFGGILNGTVGAQAEIFLANQRIGVTTLSPLEGKDLFALTPRFDLVYHFANPSMKILVG